MKRGFLFAALGLVSLPLWAAPSLFWNGEAVASFDGKSVACNTSVSVLVSFEADKVSDGTLFEVKGGGGNSSTTDVYKRVAITLSNGALNGVVAGKNGVDVTLGGAALLDSLPSGVVRAAIVIDTTSGTNVAPRAVATGGSVRSGSGFNFDNVAGTSWEANAPFNLWSVADGVLSVEVVTTSAWTEAEMLQCVSAPALYWDGTAVASFDDKALAYNESFSVLVTFDAAAVSDGTLFEVKGGGGNSSVANVYKRVAITLEGGVLNGVVAGKDGNSKTLEGTLLDSLPSGMVRVAIVVNTNTGTGVLPYAQATGGSLRSATGSGFNFDNVAGSSWSANAPFNLWSVAAGVTSVSVQPSTAWTAEEVAKKVSVPSEEGVILDVEDEVTFPEIAPDYVRFLGGTLVIPEGMTLKGLHITRDSGAGTLVVHGRLEGADSSEPLIPAFELSPEVSVMLEEGATLLMDGRLSAPVTVKGAVTLGAATAQGTLTLDSIMVEDEATVTIPQGCLEVYACPKLEAESGAAFRRWVAPGWQIRLF